MTYELTNAEKISIIDQHLKNLEYNRYNLEVSILELTSGTNPKQESIEDIQAQIDSIVAQQTALSAEVASLTV
jgi:transcriptional regulator NrdR family protein